MTTSEDDGPAPAASPAAEGLRAGPASGLTGPSRGLPDRTGSVARFLGGLLDFLLPRACALCGEPLAGPPQDASICPGCLAGLGPPGPILAVQLPLVAAGSAGPYEGPLRDVIHLLKYGRRSELAVSLGRRLASALPEALPGVSQRVNLVVPVPLHPARLAGRGFNQAALLARPVAGALGVPLAARSLVRIRDTPPQAGLEGAARRASVRGAFAVREPAAVRGRLCLLIDDVLTTGATAAACAAALRDAGADGVAVAALARA